MKQTKTISCKTKKYHKKLPDLLTVEEAATNKQRYEEIITNEFPEEDMNDNEFRDKVREFYYSFHSFFFFRTKNWPSNPGSSG